MVAIVAATVLPLLAPQFTRRFIDAATAGEPTDVLVTVAFGYLGLTITGQLARMLCRFLGVDVPANHSHM